MENEPSIFTGVWLGAIIFAVNLMFGLNRIASYKHCTNCVTKGISNISSGLADMRNAVLSGILMMGYLAGMAFAHFGIVGLILGLLGMVTPNIAKLIQARDKDYVKNQRRFTKGGLRVGAKSAKYVGTGVGYAVGGVFGGAMGNKVGQGAGKMFDAAANNMNDVDMDYDASGVDNIGQAALQAANIPLPSEDGSAMPLPNNTDIAIPKIVEPVMNQRIEPSMSNVPTDKNERLNIMRNYLINDLKLFSPETVQAASYEDTVSKIANSGADGYHPVVRKLINDYGFDEESAAVYMAQNGGIL